MNNPYAPSSTWNCFGQQNFMLMKPKQLTTCACQLGILNHGWNYLYMFMRCHWWLGRKNNYISSRICDWCEDSSWLVSTIVWKPTTNWVIAVNPIIKSTQWTVGSIFWIPSSLYLIMILLVLLAHQMKNIIWATGPKHVVIVKLNEFNAHTQPIYLHWQGLTEMNKYQNI